MKIKKFAPGLGLVVAAVAILFGFTTAAITASAQGLGDIKTPESPLILKSRGSFFVGGEKVEQTAVEVGLGPADQITINQMYVDYMIPARGDKIPVVMLHGATLSGKTYDTTPDGRMGWFEYFVRQGHPVYVPDQVGRARSGFNQAPFNNVRAGVAEAKTQTAIIRLGDKFGAWTNFRFGPKPGVPFPNTQFPLEAADQLSKQDIPDLNALMAAPNTTFLATFKALAELANQLNGAVLMGHSQSGRFPLEAALVNPKGVKGMILVEAGNCPAYSEEQLAILAKIPLLVIYGDHLESNTQFAGPNWLDRSNECRRFIARVKAAGGNAEFIFPPDLGIHGNTHMIMQDKNNLQIADLILQWIDKNVNQGARTPASR